MCGRFLLTTPVAELGRLFGFSERPNLNSRYNIAPTQSIAVVRLSEATGSRELAMVRWGLVPFWAKDTAIGNRMINARAEGLRDRPAFRQAFKQRRCIILADGFYEWQKLDKRKMPVLISQSSGRAFAMAGLWEQWRDPVSDRSAETNPVLETATIVTTVARPPIANVHNRMPLVLAEDAVEAWLGPATALEVVEQVLTQGDNQKWDLRPVSPRVNNPRNDGPELIERTLEQQSLL